MSNKKGQRRKPQSGSGRTVSKNNHSRAQRKAVTAKKTALAILVAAAATKAAAVVATVKTAVSPEKKTAGELKKGVKK